MWSLKKMRLNRVLLIRAVSLTLVLTAVSAIASAADFSGKVVGILDGDTIEVLHQGKPERIRLSGIDCPEKGQAFGQRAKQFTSDLAFGKDVMVKVMDHDRYGRTVGEVILPDGKDLNRELLKAGLAWRYSQYSKDETLGQLEAEARAAKRGLWGDPHPIPPWEFRGQARGAAPSRIEPEKRPIEATVYITKTGRKYHKEGCSYLKEGRIPIFLKEAKAKGYEPCAVCRPPR